MKPEELKAVIDQEKAHWVEIYFIEKGHRAHCAVIEFNDSAKPSAIAEVFSAFRNMTLQRVMAIANVFTPECDTKAEDVAMARVYLIEADEVLAVIERHFQ